VKSNVKVRVGVDGNWFFGPGGAELLERIDEYGSVRKAAASMDLSYSKAWKIIHRSEEGWQRPLVERTTGGAGGGKSNLTDDARKIISLFRSFEKKTNDYAGEIFGELFGEYL
jgi:molybdate transport system regulatory protein